MIWIVAVPAEGRVMAVAGKDRADAEAWYKFTVGATGMRPLYRIVIRTLEVVQTSTGIPLSASLH